MTVMRLARILRGIPIYLLARAAGISPSRLSLLERGHTTPQTAELIRLTQVLELSPERLLQQVAAEELLAGGRDG